MKPEGRSVFCYYHTQCQKTMSLFSDHHHINIKHTRYQLHSLKAWGLVQSLVYQRNAGVTSCFNQRNRRKGKDDLAAVTPLGGQVWIILKTIQFPHAKIQCLYSFRTPQEGQRGKLHKRFETIHNKPWSVILTCGMMHRERKVLPNVFPYKHFVSIPTQRFRQLAAKGQEK